MMANETAAVVEPDVQSYRLPTTVVPDRYEITLSPDLKNFTFAGEETIHITVNEPTTTITVNAAELEIQQASITNEKGTAISSTWTLDKESERLICTFAEEIKPGLWMFNIKFTGILNDKLHGFYRSKYKDTQGREKTLATTQFEATDARRAFPCWDEPEHKAIFSIKLVIDKDLTAISNASVLAENELANGKKEVVFADTIRMSTYLVAFIVGEFEGTEPTVADGTILRIWSIPGKQHLTKFAQECGAAALAFFSDYYGIHYPGDKMDLIAIPDFASGAMENLGAITFRENALLVDEKTATHAELERIADVVAHEIAHMWFGDLVTMKWWNGLWLNEAFATFMEMLAVDAWKPQWKRWETFGVSRAVAYAVDGLKSTRSIEFPVKHPDEASGMFDVLTYEKGASVLRMLEQYLGDKEFRNGIRVYLNKHKYNNAETTDLWDAIEESTKQPVRQLMDSWIFHGGFPLVSVRLDKTGTSITLSQERFLYLADGTLSNQLFHIPIMLRAQTQKGIVRKRVLMTEQTMKVDFNEKINWLVANDGAHGFYRVRYDTDLLKNLTAKIFENLSAIERFNLVGDTWASTMAGHATLSEFLQLAELFLDETDKNVWTILVGSLAYINKTIEPSVRPQLQRSVRRLLGSIKNRLGWQPRPQEDELTKQLRGMILGALGTLGDDADTQKQARDLYKSYKTGGNSVDPNVVPALVNILAHAGDTATYDDFFKEFKDAKTPQDEQRYLFSLAAFRDTSLIKRTLENAINGQVRSQNAPYLVQSLLHNVTARELAWNFLKENWEKMIELFPENSIPRMCEGITSLVSPSLEKDANQFFSVHKVKQGGKAIEQHLEKLRVAVRFKEREAENFMSIFSQPSKPSA